MAKLLKCPNCEKCFDVEKREPMPPCLPESEINICSWECLREFDNIEVCKLISELKELSNSS